MSRQDRTPTAITVTPLDLSDVEAEALDYVRAHAQTDRDRGATDVKMPSEVRVGEKWAIATKGDALYAVCTEGVGPDSPVTDEHPLAVDFYIRAYEELGDGFIALAPACEAKLSPAMLKERATGEPVPLHEWVRSFGARLERNYAAWVRLLES